MRLVVLMGVMIVMGVVMPVVVMPVPAIAVGDMTVAGLGSHAALALDGGAGRHVLGVKVHMLGIFIGHGR